MVVGKEDAWGLVVMFVKFWVFCRVLKRFAWFFGLSMGG